MAPWNVPPRRAFAAALVALSTAATAPSAAAADPATAARVAVREGLVEGVVQGDVAVYRGLPFAAAPVGERRWRAPEPAPRWDGVRSADAFGAACAQTPGASFEAGGDPGPLSEDCLYLNVYTPAARRGEALPVMVWLHGGAYVFGAGSLRLYDGSALAARGAVVVTVNYRLGALGFFSHPALDAEQRGTTAIANFGLLDQIAALRWVRDNAAAFGGDPAQVTVFGESAGAQSVLALMASPLARGLFARAIAQSPYGVPSPTLAKARDVGTRTAAALGLAGASATMAELRAVPADRFFAAAAADRTLSLAPGVVVGDAVVPRPLLEAFRRGDEAAVPLVIGSNSDETSVAVAFGIDPEALMRRLAALRIAARPLYPRGTSDAELGREVVRDVVFTAFAKRIAWLHAARAPTWRYYFSRRAEGLRGRDAGVLHGGEIPDVFGTADTCGCLAAPPVDADRAHARAVGDRWFAFAASGVPNAGAPPPWPRDERRAPAVLEFGEADGTVARPGFQRRRLDAFIAALAVAERAAPKRP